jgi:hypothetical protein
MVNTVVYNEIPPGILRVPKTKFDAVLGALLRAQPMPLASIPRKREPKPEARPECTAVENRG